MNPDKIVAINGRPVDLNGPGAAVRFGRKYLTITDGKGNEWRLDKNGADTLDMAYYTPTKRSREAAKMYNSIVHTDNNLKGYRKNEKDVLSTFNENDSTSLSANELQQMQYNSMSKVQDELDAGAPNSHVALQRAARKVLGGKGYGLMNDANIAAQTPGDTNLACKVAADADLVATALNCKAYLESKPISFKSRDINGELMDNTTFVLSARNPEAEEKLKNWVDNNSRKTSEDIHFTQRMVGESKAMLEKSKDSQERAQLYGNLAAAAIKLNNLSHNKKMLDIIKFRHDDLFQGKASWTESASTVLSQRFSLISDDYMDGRSPERWQDSEPEYTVREQRDDEWPAS